MKKFVVIAAMISVCALWAQEEAPKAAATQPAAAQPAAQVVVQPAAQPAQVIVVQAAPAEVKDEEPGIFLCIGRGLCNIATGWLELPRCIVYDNGFFPVIGLIIGIPEGALLTVCRTLSGVFDIVSFGTSGSLFHGKVFPNTVFEAKWIFRRD